MSIRDRLQFFDYSSKIKLVGSKIPFAADGLAYAEVQMDVQDLTSCDRWNEHPRSGTACGDSVRVPTVAF